MSVEDTTDSEYDDYEEHTAPVQSGGKMIGDGIYGCVFTPQLKCIPHTKMLVDGISLEKERPVSKLVDSESASVEFYLSKWISKIPLWRNYFTISESICDPAPQQTDPDLKRCEPLKKESLSDFKILTMPYRGDSLHIHRFSMQGFDFMKFATHLLEAGALLCLFQIVHRDLHQGNVLVDRHDVPRIIDFNLSFRTQQQVTSAALSHYFEPVIAHEPPDSTLVNALYQKEAYRRSYDAVIQRIIEKKSVLKRIRSLLGGSMEGMREELEEFHRKSKSAKTGDAAGWFRTYWSKIDSWAIGVILVDLIIQFSHHSSFRSNYTAIKPVLEPILRDMCQVNPMKRIDCVHALARIHPSHFILRKYGAEWLRASKTV